MVRLATKIQTCCLAGMLCAGWAIGAASSAIAADKVRIATASTSLAHGPIGLAVADPSIFGAQDITIEVRDLRGASVNCIAALLSEAVELCQVGTPTGTDAIAEGAKLKAVAVLTGPINEIFAANGIGDSGFFFITCKINRDVGIIQ